MSFERPLLLLALLAIPAAVALYVLAERRRMRYAIRFTNLEVLAAVARERAWRSSCSPWPLSAWGLRGRPTRRSSPRTARP
jgi:aerotolerance regulator-like protein